MLKKLIKKYAVFFIIVSSILIISFLVMIRFYIYDPELRYVFMILLVVEIIVLAMLTIGYAYYTYFMNKDDELIDEESVKEIVVAGGCFWGVQEYYRRLKGVLDTKVGYAQGITDNPTYEDVCSGNTNFTEVVYIKYDSNVINLNKICDHLFRIIDPLSINKQGGDVGSNYRTGVYYINEPDKKIIDKFISKQQKKYYSQIVVEVEKLIKFYDAEDYHQDYLEKNVHGYCHVDFTKIKDSEKKAEYL